MRLSPKGAPIDKRKPESPPFVEETMRRKVTLLLPIEFRDMYKRNLRTPFHQKYQMKEILFDKLYSKREMIDLASDEEAIIVTLETMDREVLSAYSELKIVANFGVGYDNVDIQAAKEKGIFVTNAPGANATSVAELTLGLILSVTRHIPHVNNRTKTGSWELVLGRELYQKTLGIIGLGNIGKKLVQMAAGFGMKIIAHDIIRDDRFAAEWNVEYTDIDRVASESDFISVHLPLSQDSSDFVDHKFLGKMKKDAVLINTARGQIVNEKDLVNALEEKRIAGAGLDVFTTEPPSFGSSLFNSTADNVVTTAHIGGSTEAALARIGEITLNNIDAAMEGRWPPNNVYSQ